MLIFRLMSLQHQPEDDKQSHKYLSFLGGNDDIPSGFVAGARNLF